MPVLEARLDLAALVPFVPRRDEDPRRGDRDGRLPRSLVRGAAGALYERPIIGGQQTVLGTGAGARNALPIAPDDLSVINAEVMAGARITLRISNPTAGALNAFIWVRLSSTPRMS